MFLAVEKLDFLVNPVSNCVRCAPLVLWSSSVGFNVDIVWFLKFDSAQFVETN
jgi:hypothetical protein